MCDCKVILYECIAKQHRMVVCKNGSHGKKEKRRESKAKDTMVKTEKDKLF